MNTLYNTYFSSRFSLGDFVPKLASFIYLGRKLFVNIIILKYLASCNTSQEPDMWLLLSQKPHLRPNIDAECENIILNKHEAINISATNDNEFPFHMHMNLQSDSVCKQMFP